MKKSIKINGLCHVDVDQYDKSTTTERVGFVAIIIGVIMAIIGNVFKSRSYCMYMDKTGERTIDVDLE